MPTVSFFEGLPPTAELSILIAECKAADGLSPFVHGLRVEEADVVFHARSGHRLVGLALAAFSGKEAGSLGVGVCPEVRGRGIGKALFHRICKSCEDALDGTSLTAWTSWPQQKIKASTMYAREALSYRFGFSLGRRLLRLGIDLPALAPVFQSGYVLDRFRPSLAEAEEVVRVNNAAFSWHPDRSAWTVEQLQEEIVADWVDLAGFFVVRHGEKLGGFCWTKMHEAESPEEKPVGEIFVVCADPVWRGKGLGRALTLSGLAYIAERSARGMLYVDESNLPARSMYAEIGFSLEQVDSCYERPKQKQIASSLLAK